MIPMFRVFSSGTKRGTMKLPNAQLGRTNHYKSKRICTETRMIRGFLLSNYLYLDPSLKAAAESPPLPHATRLSRIGRTETRLPAIMGESLVGFGHAVHVF